MMIRTPEQVLREYTPVCRPLWRSMAGWAAKARLDGESWPAWCLMPETGWSALRNEHWGDNLPGLQSTAALAELGTWRLTKGVYRLADGFAQELLRTDLGDRVPTAALQRMPEWCMYLDLQGLTAVPNLGGAWVRVTIDYSGEMSLLGIANYDTEHKPYALVPFRFELSKYGTLSELVAGNVARTREIAEAIMDGLEAAGREGADRAAEYAHMAADEPRVREFAETVLKFMLYLGSDAPDVSDREAPETKPALPMLQRHGKRELYVAASKVRTWDVGGELAESLRGVQEARSGRTVARHIRRAHWHGYWTGPRSGQREFVYRWLAPTVVGVEEKDCG